MSQMCYGKLWMVNESSTMFFEQERESESKTKLSNVDKYVIPE